MLQCTQTAHLFVSVSVLYVYRPLRLFVQNVSIVFTTTTVTTT